MNEMTNIKLNIIDNFKDHPFLVIEDDSLYELVNSVKENGLLNPLVVRPKENRYELISGHRRKRALEILGIDNADCYIKKLDDNEATIYMVDSNIYRERLLPSEKAYAYKMKIEAIKPKVKKSNFDTNCVKVKKQ